MMISVIAYFVSLGSLAVDEIGIIFCVFADDEKRRSDRVFRKKIKYFRGFSRVWTVVKCYGDALPATVGTRIYHVAGSVNSQTWEKREYESKHGAERAPDRRFHFASVPSAANSSSSVPKR